MVERGTRSTGPTMYMMKSHDESEQSNGNLSLNTVQESNTSLPILIIRQRNLRRLDLALCPLPSAYSPLQSEEMLPIISENYFDYFSHVTHWSLCNQSWSPQWVHFTHCTASILSNMIPSGFSFSRIAGFVQLSIPPSLLLDHAISHVGMNASTRWAIQKDGDQQLEHSSSCDFLHDSEGNGPVMAETSNQRQENSGSKSERLAASVSERFDAIVKDIGVDQEETLMEGIECIQPEDNPTKNEGHLKGNVSL
eukprot:Gb_26849 [translate_table: standard]